jgi:hypothetical protein
MTHEHNTTTNMDNIIMDHQDFSNLEEDVAIIPAPKKAAKVAQYYEFTINTVDDMALPSLTHLNTFLGEQGWRFVFQHERTDRDRYHGRLDVGHNTRKHPMGVLGLFHSGGFITANMTMVPEPNGAVCHQTASFYVTNSAVRVGNLWADASYQSPRVRPVYEGSDLLCMQTPLPWQAWAMAELALPADDRGIVWIYNPVGKAGKSKLQKKLCFEQLAKRICLGTATQIKTALASAGAYDAYVCNLPRTSGTSESQRDLFSSFEDVKDGWIESNMYGKDQCLFMEPPHLWIFSNDVPNMAYCSQDRWTVYQLHDMHSTPVLMTTQEVKAEYAKNAKENARNSD